MAVLFQKDNIVYAQLSEEKMSVEVDTCKYCDLSVYAFHYQRKQQRKVTQS